MERIGRRLRASSRCSTRPADRRAHRPSSPPLGPPTRRRARRARDGQVGARRGAGSSCATTMARCSASTSPNRSGFPWSFVLPIGRGVLARRRRGVAVVLAPAGASAERARRRGAQVRRRRHDRARRLAREDELGDVGRAFDDMADRTSALISSQRQLMADVSHELRTPLARIRVALELAAEDPVAAKDVLADVGTDLDEIDQLIADILTTARLDAGRKDLAREPIAVGELAEAAIARFAARHPGRTLERSIDAHRADRRMRPDAAAPRPRQPARQRGEVLRPAPVTLAGRPERRRGRLRVVDRGIGMSAEELERAGTPFWRADSSRTRKTGGVGLGLALARRIARAHGGDVTLASKLGQGTTARLRTPVRCRCLMTKLTRWIPRIVLIAIIASVAALLVDQEAVAAERGRDLVLDGDRPEGLDRRPGHRRPARCRRAATVQVGAQVSGRVVELHADFNDRSRRARSSPSSIDSLLKAQIDAVPGRVVASRARTRRRPRSRSTTPSASYKRQKRSRISSSSRRPRSRASRSRAIPRRPRWPRPRRASASPPRTCRRRRRTCRTRRSTRRSTASCCRARRRRPDRAVLAARRRRCSRSPRISSTMQIDTAVAEGDVGRLEERHEGDVHGRRVPGRQTSRARCARSATRRPRHRAS